MHPSLHRSSSDLRSLNKHVHHDPFPIPNISHILDNFANTALYSTIDLCSGFLQMKVHPDDTHKLAFSTYQGHYEWLRAPFGLKNSPNSFQRLMQLALAGLQPLQIACYIDDIIVASTSSVDEHLKKLETVFKCLEKHRLKIKPSKCVFKSIDKYINKLFY